MPGPSGFRHLRAAQTDVAWFCGSLAGAAGGSLVSEGIGRRPGKSCDVLRRATRPGINGAATQLPGCPAEVLPAPGPGFLVRAGAPAVARSASGVSRSLARVIAVIMVRFRWFAGLRMFARRDGTSSAASCAAVAAIGPPGHPFNGQQGGRLRADVQVQRGLGHPGGEQPRGGQLCVVAGTVFATLAGRPGRVDPSPSARPGSVQRQVPGGCGRRACRTRR